MSISIRVTAKHVTQKTKICSISNCDCEMQDKEENIFIARIRPDGEMHQVFKFGKNFGTSISSRGEIMPYVKVIE